MSSSLIVIIRLFYTLTALDMKRNCWTPGYVFHYLTALIFPTCPSGIGHLYLPSGVKCVTCGQLERNERNTNSVPLISRL